MTGAAVARPAGSPGYPNHGYPSYGYPGYGYGYYYPAYGYYPYGYYPWGWGGFGFGFSFYYGYPGYYAPWGGWGWGGYGYPVAYAGDGSVRIKIKPSNAQVFVDGSYAGVVDDFDGSWQSLHLEPGPHRIEVREDGFESMFFDVRITRDHTITYTGELKKN